MSLSHSAQTFCPGGRLDCGVDGCDCCFVSGAETGLSPARAGEHGVITPLCAVGSAISQRSYRTGMHQANWSQLIQSLKNRWRDYLSRVTLFLTIPSFHCYAPDYRYNNPYATTLQRFFFDFFLFSFFFSFISFTTIICIY